MIGILIVGAMAISPDALPIAAACIGLVSRRLSLVGRAFSTLALGPGAAAAGVAGMLALETRASAGVGVAISVTTIPAAGYLGVAAAVGELDKASAPSRYSRSTS